MFSQNFGYICYLFLGRLIRFIGMAHHGHIKIEVMIYLAYFSLISFWLKSFV